MKKLIIIPLILFCSIVFGQTNSDTVFFLENKGFISELRYSAAKDTLFFNGDTLLMGAGSITGTGTINWHSKFTGTSAIGNSSILDTETDTTLSLNDTSVIVYRDLVPDLNNARNLGTDEYSWATINGQKIVTDTMLVGTDTVITGTFDAGYLLRGAVGGTTVENSIVQDDGSNVMIGGSISLLTGTSVNKITTDSTFVSDYNHNTIPTVKTIMDFDSTQYLTTYAVDSLRTSGADTLFLATHRGARTTLAGNATLYLDGLVEGYSGNIRIVQGGTGSYTFSITNANQDIVNGDATYIYTALGDVTAISWWYVGSRLMIVYNKFN